MIKKELNIYGDNIVECFKFIKNIQQTFSINKIVFSEKCNFLVPQVLIKNNEYEFIINLFANYDKWENNPIQFISKKFGAKLQEYPDVIVFEKKNLTDNLNYKNNGTNSNLTISQQKRTITEEIKKNYRLKDEIIDNILNVQNKEEHVSLIIDKILFDNTVMLDRIFKNLNDLSNIL